MGLPVLSVLAGGDLGNRPDHGQVVGLLDHVTAAEKQAVEPLQESGDESAQSGFRGNLCLHRDLLLSWSRLGMSAYYCWSAG